MYFSKIRLHNSLQGRKELARLGLNGLYAAHQLLWKVFTEADKREFLFREEQIPSGLPEYFVLSKQRPVAMPQLFDIQTKPFTPQLKSGDRLAYKIRVNPTICVKSPSGKRQRHDVLMHAKLQAKANGVTEPVIMQERMTYAAQSWFADERRLDRWGIQLDMLPDIESYVQHQLIRGKKQQVQFSSVDFQGVLTVINPSSFTAALRSGIGKSKAFGCGLMLIRRMEQNNTASR